MDNPLEGSVVGKKLGPLPIWAWALAGVVVFLVVRRFLPGSSTVSQDTSADDTGTYDDSGTGFGDLSSSGLSSSGGTSSGGTDATSSDDSGGDIISTLSDWAVSAINFLVKAGNSPIAVNNALAAFTNGQTLTQSQADYISKAIAGIGAPPDGSYPINITKPAPAAPTTTPSKPTTKVPGKVTGLKAQAAKPKQVTVKWTAYPGATGYVVTVTGAKQAKDNKSYTVAGSQISLSGLTVGEKFKVHVKVRNSAGTGPESVLQINLPNK